MSFKAFHWRRVAASSRSRRSHQLPAIRGVLLPRHVMIVASVMAVASFITTISISDLRIRILVTALVQSTSLVCGSRASNFSAEWPTEHPVRGPTPRYASIDPFLAARTRLPGGASFLAGKTLLPLVLDLLGSPIGRSASERRQDALSIAFGPVSPTRILPGDVLPATVRQVPASCSFRILTICCPKEHLRFVLWSLS